MKIVITALMWKWTSFWLKLTFTISVKAEITDNKIG